VKKQKQKEKVCPICGGDGYVRGKTGMIRCQCVKDELYKKLGKFCNMSVDQYETEVNFENYNIKTSQGTELSYKQLMNYILLHYKEKKKLELYFQGPRGVGKTLFANKLIAKIVKMVERKKNFEDGYSIKKQAHIISNVNLLSLYGKFNDQEKQRQVEEIRKKRILIIDGFLQNIDMQNFKKTFMNELIKERSSDNYITILISQNSIIESINEINDKKKRLQDVLSEYQIVKFRGNLYDSYRGKNKKDTLDNVDLNKLEGVDVSEI